MTIGRVKIESTEDTKDPYRYIPNCEFEKNITDDIIRNKNVVFDAILF